MDTFPTYTSASKKDLIVNIAKELLASSTMRTSLSIQDRDRKAIINDCYTMAEEFVRIGQAKGYITE